MDQMPLDYFTNKEQYLESTKNKKVDLYIYKKINEFEQMTDGQLIESIEKNIAEIKKIDAKKIINAKKEMSHEYLQRLYLLSNTITDLVKYVQANRELSFPVLDAFIYVSSLENNPNFVMNSLTRESKRRIRNSFLGPRTKSEKKFPLTHYSFYQMQITDYFPYQFGKKKRYTLR